MGTRRNRERRSVRPVVCGPDGRQLRSQGYQVILNKVGTAPPNQCAVSAFRRGQTFSRTDSGVPGAGNDVITTVTNKTVYVDVKC